MLLAVSAVMVQMRCLLCSIHHTFPECGLVKKYVQGQRGIEEKEMSVVQGCQPHTPNCMLRSLLSTVFLSTDLQRSKHQNSRVLNATRPNEVVALLPAPV